MWRLWLLSMVLKRCCHGSSIEKGNMAIFTSVCVCCNQTAVQSRASERGVERDFLLALRQVWAGQRASQHAWPQGPFDLRLLDMQSLTLSSVSYWRFDVLEMWVLRGHCVFMIGRRCKVSGTWAFSWVTERSSGWRPFIPSSCAVWRLSKTSWTSWST